MLQPREEQGRPVTPFTLLVLAQPHEQEHVVHGPHERLRLVRRGGVARRRVAAGEEPDVLDVPLDPRERHRRLAWRAPVVADERQEVVGVVADDGSGGDGALAERERTRGVLEEDDAVQREALAVQMCAAPRPPYTLALGSPSKWPSRTRVARGS
jgi:hypothetical protein